MSRTMGRRFRRAIFPAILLVALFVFVRACVPEPINDLRLIEARRIPVRETPSSTVLREISAPRETFVWKVSVLGSAHWLDEIRRHELNSYGILRRCDKGEFGVFNDGPYVGDIGITHYGPGFTASKPRSATVQYDFYVPETGRYISQSDMNKKMPAYDLAKEALWLCLRIAGGAMHGAYGVSNEVRVEVGQRGK